MQLADNGGWRALLERILEEEAGPSQGKLSALAILETGAEDAKLIHYILFREVERAFGKKARCERVMPESQKTLFLVLHHGLEETRVEQYVEEVFALLCRELGFACRAGICHGVWEEGCEIGKCREAEQILLEAALLPGGGLFHREDVRAFSDVSYEPEEEEIRRLLELLQPSADREQELKKHMEELLEKFSRSRFSRASVCGAFGEILRAVTLEMDEELWERRGKALLKEAGEELEGCRTLREFREVCAKHLLGLAAVLEKANLSEGMKIVSRMKSRIRTEYSQNLKLSTFAAEYYMNQSYLSVLFQQETGTSFSQYLTEVRLKKARELLKTTALPTRKIAELVGYKDRNYFAAVFSRYEGLTPMQYRKAFKDEERRCKT